MNVLKVSYLFTFLHIVESCTELFVTSKDDDAVIVGRSMEFAMAVYSNMVVEPKYTKKESFAPSHCAERFIWQNKYDVICIDAMRKPVCTDGMNNAGLSASSLLLPGFTKYENISTKDCDKAVSNLQLVGFIVGTFNSTAAVRKAISTNGFPKVFNQRLNMITFELRYSIIDSTGDALVIEYTHGGRKIYDNTVNVITNSPTYDIHMENLQNYVQLSKFAIPPGNATNTPLNIPGDVTSKSRFIRTAAILHSTDVLRTSTDAVNYVFHIMNAVDMPKGVVQINTVPDPALFGYTQWIVVKDLKNRIIYIRTYDDLSIRKVDMKKIRSNKIVKLPIERELNGAIEDITDTFNMRKMKSKLYKL